MRTMTIMLACAAAAALVTVDHFAATGGFVTAGKADRLIAQNHRLRPARDAMIVQTRDRTTIAVRTRGPEQLAHDVARSPIPPRPTPAKRPANSRERLPQACEPSVSPLASNTAFGARCVT